MLTSSNLLFLDLPSPLLSLTFLGPEPITPPPDPVVIRQSVNGPDGGESVILIVDVLGRGGLDVVRGDGVDAGERLGEG